VFDEPLVHAPVVADGEREHGSVDRIAAIPDGA
jgi:hypothetical protein